MPIEEGYSARVMPQAGAAMPLTRPETYGAGVAKAAGELGETIHETLLRAHLVERRLTADREGADFAHRFALHRQNMDGVVQQLRTHPTSPDYAEHVALVQKVDQNAREGMLAGITEESVRNRAVEQLDAYGAQLHDSEFTYAETQRVAKFGFDLEKTVDLQANRIASSDNPASFAEEVKTLHETAAGLQNVPPLVRKTSLM